MGRSSKHLRYSIVSVKPPSEGRSEKALASFWAQELNQLSLDSVTASTTEQCYFKKLCGRHYSKQSPCITISRRGVVPLWTAKPAKSITGRTSLSSQVSMSLLHIRLSSICLLTYK